jgi:hypothetical protein
MQGNVYIIYIYAHNHPEVDRIWDAQIWFHFSDEKSWTNPYTIYCRMTNVYA